jgi:8-oxo-dGTP pyrophosphatase MutT (NUDIX family)
MAARKALANRPATLHQIAALPIRAREGHVEVCLITTRETGRWSLPKGWPMKGRHDFAAARIEAEQEAGVTGKPGKTPIGSFLYWKRRDRHFGLVEVTVYPLLVTDILSSWKEQAQRHVRWATPRDASLVVDEPGLAALLVEIDAMQLTILDSVGPPA